MGNCVNKSDENNSSCWCSEQQTYTHSLLFSTVYLVMFVVGSTGNILLIRALVCTKKQKRFLDCIFINLAVANILCLLILPFLATQSLHSDCLICGRSMCMISSYVTFTATYAASFCLLSLSINRWMAILYPIISQKERRQSTILVASFVIWIMAFLLAIPHAVFQKAKAGNGTMCTSDFNSLYVLSPMLETSKKNSVPCFEAVFKLVLTIITFAIPVILMVIFLVSAVSVARCSEKSKVEDFRARTLLTIVSALLVVFLICWSPFHVISTWTAVMQLTLEPAPISLCCTLNMVHQYAVHLGNIYAALNPFVYVAFDPRFRAECWATLTCRRC
ncbi:apelin receptor A-like [Protopterus annectens]|uniref:apelin receptor A-like n=1 Tax=Protopterus annectens TaxID=7888 RepID=UPI001CFC0C12|nr:apelin receptor A-like [Protopterus annectens]